MGIRVKIQLDIQILTDKKVMATWIEIVLHKVEKRSSDRTIPSDSNIKEEEHEKTERPRAQRGHKVVKSRGLSGASGNQSIQNN